MSIIGRYRSRKYFIRILLSITLTVVGFLTAISVVNYTNSKHTVMDLQQESARNVLNQVDYNINYLDQMVDNLTISTFSDRNIIALMENRELEIHELTSKLASLENIVAANPYIDSIIIYNELNGCYYSTSDSNMASCGKTNIDNSLSRFFETRESVPKFKMVPTAYDAATGSVRTFSQFMYKSLEAYRKNESILMVNIKPEWLFDNISTINERGGNMNSRIYIVNAEGQFFTSGDQGLPNEAFQATILQRIHGLAADYGYFIEHSGQVGQIVSFSRSQANGLSVISIQPYDSVFGKINKIKQFSIWMLIFFLVCAVAVSLWFAVKLYKPVRSLLDAVRPEAKAGQTDPVKDEFLFMSTVYRQTLVSLNEYKEKQHQSQDMIYQYKLRKFFTDSGSFESSDREWLFGPTDGEFAAGGKLFIFVLKIDDYKSFVEKRKQAEQKLVGFAITNICAELINRAHKGHVVEMRNDHYAAILQIVASPRPQAIAQEHENGVVPIVQEMQRVIWDNYRVSLTVAISDGYDDCLATSAIYKQTEERALYRFLLGKRAVITAADVDRLQTLAGERRIFPQETEGKLIEDIRSGDLKRIESRLQSLFAHLSEADYTYAVNSILHLMAVINQTMREINAYSHNRHQAGIDMKYYQSFFEKDTLDEVLQQFMVMFRDMQQHRASLKTVKHDARVEAIKEIVAEHYEAPELSLPFIATMVRMTPTHTGRLFKKNEHVSLVDYIHEVRLKHAIELLGNEELSVAEIMKKVGYINESHFFKIFKKKTGATPSEYRKSITINRPF
ncbi:AraC family transcriptional regulator [Paenibacillus cymbidii]|uniref:AraC family transcriptional regulator n=1 Tax=Paenibacillus cymbidii TaxID=1639034 RepID=UPI0014367B4C|nr:AraC family transcriptional regulator [Paenibacillus cymbidii]